MIKGCSKRVIVMKETGNDMIEEAFFILKPGIQKKSLSESDLVTQAKSLLEKSERNTRFNGMNVNFVRQKPPLKIASPFIWGFALGVLAGVIGTMRFPF